MIIDGKYQACSQCVFWLRNDARYESYSGKCRRYPPTSRSTTDLDYQPNTAEGHWCGEFKKKEE
jgi:hypothetical protein